MNHLPGGGVPHDRAPQLRYVLPSFVERTSYGIKESNPYNKLFEERIIFLGVQVDDASANDIMAQLLVLESLDPDRDITMYINSPGGGFTSLMAIYDTMQYVRADIQTVCLGQAASAAAVLLAAGTPGKRMALPNARVLIHQPSLSGVIQGQFSDLEIQAAGAAGLAARVRNAGAVFVGPYAPVSLGDYLAGSNHVLPTGGTARHSGGLSVLTFLRGIHIVEYDAAALTEVAPYIDALGGAEDLAAHVNAVRARGGNVSDS